MAKQIIIIGGGIGGLAVAAALRQMGLCVLIYERAEALREVGAGLAIWANAVRVLHHLGLQTQLEAVATPVNETEICTPSGDVLARLDMRALADEAGVPNYLMHRHDLLSALRSLLPDDVIRTGATCVAVEEDSEGVVAHFDHGSRVRGDVLIGADGIHSVVRKALWGETSIRYSGQTCYRGVAFVSPRHPGVNREVNGPGRRFGIAPLDAERVYWWAAYNASEGVHDDPKVRQRTLLNAYQGWPWRIPTLIEHTPTNTILRNDLIDRSPLRRWSQGRITLLGDAAHPMTPNLGQGSCSAIEDALVLARCLALSPSTQAAFDAYESARLRRTRSMTQQAWLWGRLARWKHPVALKVREGLIRFTPHAVLRASLRRLICYDVGSLPAQIIGLRSAP